MKLTLLVVMVAAVVVSGLEYQGVGEVAGLQQYEAPTHRQFDLEDDFHHFGDIDLPPEDSGFFQGNSLPRPFGLSSLPGFNEPVPTDGFEPDPAVGGPAPFSIPELKEPPTFLEVYSQLATTTRSQQSETLARNSTTPSSSTSPTSSSSSPTSSSSTSHEEQLPQAPHPPASAADTATKLKDHPGRLPSRGKPGRRPKFPRKRRPQRQFSPQRESLEVGDAPLRPLGGRLRQRGKNNNNIGQDREGVTGFINAFKRLIQRVM